MTDAILKAGLEALERKWVAALQSKFTADQPWPEVATGDIQFFCTMSPKSKRTGVEQANVDQQDRSQLVIVCIGMNYNAYGHPSERKAEPHTYKRSNAQTWIVDDNRSRATRRALGAALNAYIASSDSWANNGYASGTKLVPKGWALGSSQCSALLVRTFLCPFLLAKPWGELSRSNRIALLNAWNPNQHICDLIATLGSSIDLWVIQGTSLWPHFDVTNPHISNWLLTPTLSFESQRNQSIETFWKGARRAEVPRQPRFPSC